MPDFVSNAKSRIWRVSGEGTEGSYKNLDPGFAVELGPNPQTKPNDEAMIDKIAPHLADDVISDADYAAEEAKAARRPRLPRLRIREAFGELLGYQVIPQYDGIIPGQDAELDIDPRRPEIPADIKRFLAQTDKIDFPDTVDETLGTDPVMPAAEYAPLAISFLFRRNRDSFRE